MSENKMRTLANLKLLFSQHPWSQPYLLMDPPVLLSLVLSFHMSSAIPSCVFLLELQENGLPYRFFMHTSLPAKELHEIKPGKNSSTNGERLYLFIVLMNECGYVSFS